VQQHPPLQINPEVVVPWNVNRTHAYALSRAGMKAVYQHIAHSDWWAPKRHIDHRLGQLHQQRNMPIYCPTRWLLSQAEGKSDISGARNQHRDWQIKSNRFVPLMGPPPWEKPPFFAIVGLHSSGSSAIAGVCYHLGMHLGDRLGGFYGNKPESSCGFEARGLSRVCERLARFPQIVMSENNHTLAENFRNWLLYSWNKAQTKGTVAGGKYPLLCRMGPWLQKNCGDGLRIIHCVRPIEDSIRSLVNRGGTPHCTLPQADLVQRWLQTGKESLLSAVPVEHVLDVDYNELLHNTHAVVERIGAFIRTNPSTASIDKAVASVRPKHPAET
jgi:hypothetical protein